MNKANDIEYFIEGISAVCNDKSLITKKVKERFDSEYSKLIDYLLLVVTVFQQSGMTRIKQQRI
jgi:hypothetical protein